ncbi:MAG: hypothetical protein M3Q51_02740 [Pseudomonadota bacterium]|nr:hypothetical protein [Pseudomonadota bacterium]MDQ3159921.1 hypothetical protein [Pseudomonadota bacterium]
MSAGLLAQYMVIALAVCVSLMVVLRKQFPASTRRMRIALAIPMLRENSPAWLQKCGRWIAPEPAASAKSCGGCDSCD